MKKKHAKIKTEEMKNHTHNKTIKKMEEVNHSLSQQLQMLKDTFSKTKREKQQCTRTVQNDNR